MNVYWMIQATINDGQLDALKAQMTTMVEATQTNEPGALNYEWWIGADEKTLHIYERYADSDAVMAHMVNIKSHLPAFMGMITMTAPITVYGPANDQVKAAFADMGPIYLGTLGGFAR